MKPRRLAFLVLAILLVTALSAAGVTAQTVPQQAQSGDIATPTDVSGPGPVNISSDRETGNKQTSITQSAGPQPKQPRGKGERNKKDDAAPAEAAPSGGNPTGGGNGGTGGAAPAPSPQPRVELPKTGGSSVDSLFALGAGVLLIGGGLLARRIIK
jgi:LPXTG-motif cell wall-anchored protein